MPCRPSPVQVPSRVRRGPVQIRHVLSFTAFQTHPGPEGGGHPARPGPILVPSVPSGIEPGRAETDFLATSDLGKGWLTILKTCYGLPSKSCEKKQTAKNKSSERELAHFYAAHELRRPRNYDFRAKLQVNLPRCRSGNDREMTILPPGHH